MFHWTLQKKAEAAEHFETWERGGGWRGAYLHLAMHIPVLKFSKIPLAIFTVSSLSVQTGRGLKKEKMAKRVRGGGVAIICGTAIIRGNMVLAWMVSRKLGYKLN